MEGVLWKWTNYWNGWQQRWFVLDKGILTYYKSQEEVNQGCKGSVKVAACEIVVHQTDSKRLDLVIPSEQHFYLRAATAQDRQQWLVALGSSKAAQQKAGAGEALPGGVQYNVRLKKSELRLYCDLLMQQVHTIKTSAGEDLTKVSEAAELLRATCDTFINTLEDCMRIADANFTYELPHQEVRDSALPHEVPNPVAPVVLKTLQGGPQHQRRRRKSSNLTPTTPSEPPGPDAFPDAVIPVGPTPSNGTPRQVQTFFSTMDHSFVGLAKTTREHIPTLQFLDCCQAVLPVFDVLGSTAFAPVKMDIQGNINKLTTKYRTAPAKCASLLGTVRREMDDGTTGARNSSTDALLWLKRALEFIHAFLCEIHSGKQTLAECAGAAYGRTLKSHHGWVVRGVFLVALRALPDFETFVLALAPTPQDAEHPDYKRQLFVDCGEYIDALRSVLQTINDFYVGHDLETGAKT